MGGVGDEGAGRRGSSGIEEGSGMVIGLLELERNCWRIRRKSDIDELRGQSKRIERGE